MPNKNNVNTGNAGEYFVAGELERRGFTVAVPMSNVESFDILAINKKTYKHRKISIYKFFYIGGEIGRLSLRSKHFRLAAASQAGVALRRTTEYFLKHSRNARKSQICFISFCFSYILEKTMIHRFFFGDPAFRCKPNSFPPRRI